MKGTNGEVIMKYTNITPSFGVELVSGTQLQDFTDDEVTALKQLAAERGIVVARDQEMDMKTQAEFGRRLGRLMNSPVKNRISPKS